MKRRFKRFVSDTINYEFPLDQQAINWNFTNVVPRITKLAGMDGGFDEFQGGRAPSEVGNISTSWMLISPNWAGLRPMIDAARAIAGSGVGYLLTIPQDQQDEMRGLRWAQVRPNSVQIPENSDAGLTSIDVQANFQAASPVWYGCQPTTDTSEPSYNRAGWWNFDDGWTWDTPGMVWGGARNTVTMATNTTTTCTNRGNHSVWPTIRLSGATASNIRVQRLNSSGNVLDEFLWNDTKANNETLVVDGATASVTIEGPSGNRDAYSDFEVVVGSGFLEFAPGANIVNVQFDIGASLNVVFEYPDAWY